jgi:subtilisin family serine protease
VLAQMAGDARIVRAQPNYVYALQQGEQPLKAEPTAQTISPEVIVAPVIVEPAPLPASNPEVAPRTENSAIAEPERKSQYVLGKMGIDQIQFLSRGAKIKVAVIDTGVDDKHPELNGVISRQYDALGGEISQSDNHGTAMAGAIVAKATLRGISPGAELLMARAFAGPGVRPTSGSEGTTFHILKSLDWAHSEKARVVNLSFSGPEDRLLSRALENARAKGMIAVAAAGNGGPKAAPSFPAADPSVIAVTATDADDKIFPQANNGSYIAVAAPGVDVISAEPLASYGFSSGTSVAAAHVSGLIALMLEQNADLDLPRTRSILSETAVDLGTKGHDRIFGAGRINAQAALKRVMELPPIAVPAKN